MKREPPAPRYRFPLSLLLPGVLSVALGWRRDIVRDAELALGAAPVRPVVRGPEQLPPTGALVIVANHYERPGLWVGWGVALITSAAARQRPGCPPVRWVHVSEWSGYNFYGLVLPTSFTRWLIRRVSRAWGVVPIPPPGRASMADAHALVRAARLVLDGSDEVLGVFPEGGPSVELREALPGSGGFLLRLSERGVPLVPVGLAECEGALTATFGPPFRLTTPAGLPSAERDELARREVMTAIARLLPPALRGEYQQPRSTGEQ